VLSAAPVHSSHASHRRRQLTNPPSTGTTESSIDIATPSSAAFPTSKSLGDIVVSSPSSQPQNLSKSLLAEACRTAADATEVQSRGHSASHVVVEVKNDTSGRAPEVVHRRRRKKGRTKKKSLVTGDEKQQQQQPEQTFSSQELSL